MSSLVTGDIGDSVRPHRVTVIGDVTLSRDALATLELGPSFAPSRGLSHGAVREIVCSLQGLRDRLRGRAKIDAQGGQLVPVGSALIPTPPFPGSFLSTQPPNRSIDAKFRILATSLLTVVQRGMKKNIIPNLTPGQRRGLKEIKELVSRGALKVGVSDKGGEFVVLPQEMDKTITALHLQNNSVYAKSTCKEFTAQSDHLKRTWTSIATEARFDPKLVTRLRCTNPVCPVLYVLIKTHKLPTGDAINDPSQFKVRPIISGVGGPTDRVSWLLNLVLKQTLQFLPAHLPNTTAFLEKLRKVPVDGNCFVESFDVTSLYTNVPKDRAMQAVHEILVEHQGQLNLYGLNIAQVMTLTNECLQCNVFRWSNNYYKQVSGLAMGQRLAPVLAIAFMSKIETPVLERKPLLYCRYIDDCFIVCATQNEMDLCFELLNNQAESIKLTREKPTGRWLPYLNVEVGLTGGKFHTRWYRKPSSKNIIVHFRSAHPSQTKRAVVKNMFRTAAMVSSNSDLKTKSLQMANRIAIENGYPDQDMPRGHRTPAVASGRRQLNDSRIVFKVPFVSDEVGTEIRNCVRKAGLDNMIRVVEVPPSNLKARLVRNRLYDSVCRTRQCIVCPNGKEGDCMVAGVVYLIKCTVCNGEYIGETGRPLGERVKEHLGTLRRCDISEPLGEHRLRCHDGAMVEVAVAILSRESEISARKTLEALWIAVRNPTINRKEERVEVTQELAAFADLCGLDPKDSRPEAR
ncbi:hypothetical protein Q1695_016084 [Nippostrongylus brasiliensis]|nr:hypothetical protein Q1695_016083 [Nippostrongylus brasiliensis]WKY02528.1 hypothetical protein Q1695_016084 [Nippostrongylus brasiliensis]